MIAPTIVLVEKAEGGDLGYWVGVCLDELVALAREGGASESDLEERLEDAFGRYEEAEL